MGEFEAKERSLNNTPIEIFSFYLSLLGRRKIFLYPFWRGVGKKERGGSREGSYSSPLLSSVPTQAAARSPFGNFLFPKMVSEKPLPLVQTLRCHPG